MVGRFLEKKKKLKWYAKLKGKEVLICKVKICHFLFSNLSIN